MKTLFAILISLVVAFSVSEFIFQRIDRESSLALSSTYMDSQNFKANEAAEPDPVLGYKLKKNFNSAGFHINQWGFVGNDFEKYKDGRIRVFCVGGSTTLGAGEAAIYTYPALLQKILDVLCPKSFEVLNAGVFGYHSYHSLIRISNELEEFEPDIIILMDGLNDVLTADKINMEDIQALNENSKKLLLALVKDKDANLIQRIFPKISFRLNKLLLEKFKQPKSESELKNKIESFGYKDNLRKMIAQGKKKGMDFLLINYPWINVSNSFVQMNKGIDDHFKYLVTLGKEEVSKANNEISKKENISFIDPQEQFDVMLSEDTTQRKVYSDTIHFTRFTNLYLAWTALKGLQAMKSKLPCLKDISFKEALSMFPGIKAWNPGDGIGWPDGKYKAVETQAEFQGVKKEASKEITTYFVEDDKARISFPDGANSGKITFFPRVSGDGDSKISVYAGDKMLFKLENIAKDGIWTPLSGRYSFIVPEDQSTNPIEIVLEGSGAQIFSIDGHFFFLER